MKIFKLVVLICFTITGTTNALAIPLYSIDITNDNLVRLDSSSGVVSNIGSLGFDATSIELALTSDGRLWGLNTLFGERVDLLEINKNTGAIQSQIQIFDGDVAVKNAEGLGAQGNQLKIAYAQTNIDNNAFSNQLANLSVAGVISNVLTSNVDMDGLASGYSNISPLYGFDRVPGTHTRLFGIDSVTGVGTAVGTYSDDLGFVDLVTLTGEAIAIDTFTNSLYQIDLETGLFIGDSTILQSSMDFDGLALAEPLVSVSSPASLASICLGLAFMRSFRRT